MSFNITTKKIEDAAFLHFNDPETDMPLWADDAETLPVGINVYSKGSKAYRNALSALARKNLMNKGKRTFEQNIEDNNRLLAAVCKESVNFDMGDGVALTTTDQFYELFATPELYWCKDAVSAFLDQDANFTQK